MKKERILFPIIPIIAAFITAWLSNFNRSGRSLEIQGDFFVQAPPGNIFASNIISPGMNERDFAISRDGHEIFFSREANESPMKSFETEYFSISYKDNYHG